MKTPGKEATSATRPVIICTEYRGVFFGYVNDKTNREIIERGNVNIKDARMAISWGTTRGVLQLACTGPTSKSTISEKADITLNKITAIFEVTDAAHSQWQKVK